VTAGERKLVVPGLILLHGSAGSHFSPRLSVWKVVEMEVRRAERRGQIT